MVRVEELLESFFSFTDHVVQHGDDVVLVPIVRLGDLVDGVLELLVVPDDVQDILVDAVHVLGLLLVVLGDDMPLSFFLILSNCVPIVGLYPQ